MNAERTIADFSVVELVYWLRLGFLYSLGWNTPAFRKARLPDKAEFESIVNGGDLFLTMRNLSHECLNRGTQLPDVVLAAILDLVGIKPGKPLPKSNRERIQQAHDAAFVLERRLDAEAMKRRKPETRDEFIKRRRIEGAALKDIEREVANNSEWDSITAQRISQICKE